MGKIRDFLEDVRDFATLVAAAPTALKVSGTFTQGVSKTIANPTAAKVLYKSGEILRNTGTGLGKILKAGTTAVIRKTTPVVTTVAKSLPGSRYIAPIVKYIPSTAVAITGAVLANKAKNIATEISKIKRDPIAKLASDKSKFNVLDPNSWVNLVREAFTFK
jgi:hypothetical protein